MLKRLREEGVEIDLQLYYASLRPRGVLFGDDYSLIWLGVAAAVNRFAELMLFCGGGNFLVQKPG
jgi:hypothetical protein